MNTVFGSGLALTVLGLIGYLAGVVSWYPGRAFALTGLMVGMTLVAVGHSLESEALA